MDGEEGEYVVPEAEESSGNEDSSEEDEESEEEEEDGGDGTVECVCLVADCRISSTYTSFFVCVHSLLVEGQERREQLVSF